MGMGGGLNLKNLCEKKKYPLSGIKMTDAMGQSNRNRLPAFHRMVRGLASLPFTMGTTWI